MAAEEFYTINTKLDIEERVKALERIAVSVKDAQRFDRRIALGIMSVFVAAAIAFFALTHRDLSSSKTDLAILKDDVEIMKVDVADLKKGQTRIFSTLTTPPV